MQNNILESFAGKVLAVRLYKSDKKQFGPEEFVDVETLREILEEIESGESDITEDGKAFLQTYYSLEELAHVRNMSMDEIDVWLENLQPMEVANFIKTSRDKEVT